MIALRWTIGRSFSRYYLEHGGESGATEIRNSPVR
jgi:hypothetical protein